MGREGGSVLSQLEGCQWTGDTSVVALIAGDADFSFLEKKTFGNPGPASALPAEPCFLPLVAIECPLKLWAGQRAAGLRAAGEEKPLQVSLMGQGFHRQDSLHSSNMKQISFST